MEAFKAKYGYDLGVPKNFKQLHRHRRVLQPACREPLRRRDLYPDRLRRHGDGRSSRLIFTYGGRLGDYATNKVDGILNSDEERARRSRPIASSTPSRPPNWSKAFFAEDNRRFTEGLVAMNMNYFAFFPALANKATNPHADVTGYFANPPGPNGDQHRGARRSGHLDHLVLEEPGSGDEIPRMVHQGRDPEEVGRPRWLHLQCRSPRSRTSSSTRRRTTRRSTRPCSRSSRTSGRCRNTPTCSIR